MSNNLTRDEARDRADLITVQSYAISLDLTGVPLTRIGGASFGPALVAA